MTPSTTIRLLAAALTWIAPWAPGCAAEAPRAAIVSIAEGPGFFVIRGATVYAGSRGVTLFPGDILQTGAGCLVILELQGESATDVVAAIGPMTRAYWMDRRPADTLAVLGGWVKVDTLASARGVEFKAVGPRLGASSAAGVYVLHGDEAGDELFGESGPFTVWLLDADGGNRAAPGRQNDFLRRTDFNAPQLRRGPGPAFVAALPAAFRDPLPTGIAATMGGRASLLRVRDVQYADIADWLAAPRSWRRGFVERFRGQLKDPAFFHALDAELDAHPEWRRVLHPPQPRQAPQAPGSR